MSILVKVANGREAKFSCLGCQAEGKWSVDISDLFLVRLVFSLPFRFSVENNKRLFRCIVNLFESVANIDMYI